MKIKSLIKYGLRFILLQAVLSIVLIWYFDNYLIISQDQKYLIYLSLVDDWERFYPFFPLKYVTVDTVLVLMIFIFLFVLYSTKFYTYVNELTYSFRKNYFDEFLSIYLLWCSFMFSFFLLFRISGIYRSNLILLTFIVPVILMIFRNSELLSILLGRSLFNENYISFNLDKDSSLRNLRILSFRNEVENVSIDFNNNFAQIENVIEEVNKSVEINLVVINIENFKEVTKEIENYLVNLNKKVLLISNESIIFNTNFILRREKFENYYLAYFNNDIQYGAKFIIKRLFDIFVSLNALILLSPIWLFILIYITAVDNWPPIVIQNRVGLHGKVFKMYKFRTMYKEAHKLRDDLSDKNKKTGPLFKLDDDPRIIKGGKTIRRYSLDELPQLINVIRGNMSLVGPRPLFDTDRQYFKGGYMRRLNVMPGMTGLLQIKDRNTDDFEVWFKYDLEYIEKWSLYLDFIILVKTVPSLFHQKVQGR
jgi:lipopolysaccharide/colanic/teichoic acid biosynthesis glycosyltransferase